MAKKRDRNRKKDQRQVPRLDEAVEPVVAEGNPPTEASGLPEEPPPAEIRRLTWKDKAGLVGLLIFFISLLVWAEQIDQQTVSGLPGESPAATVSSTTMPFATDEIAGLALLKNMATDTTNHTEHGFLPKGTEIFDKVFWLRESFEKIQTVKSLSYEAYDLYFQIFTLTHRQLAHVIQTMTPQALVDDAIRMELAYLVQEYGVNLHYCTPKTLMRLQELSRTGKYRKFAHHPLPGRSQLGEYTRLLTEATNGKVKPLSPDDVASETVTFKKETYTLNPDGVKALNKALAPEALRLEVLNTPYGFMLIFGEGVSDTQRDIFYFDVELAISPVQAGLLACTSTRDFHIIVRNHAIRRNLSENLLYRYQDLAKAQKLKELAPTMKSLQKIAARCDRGSTKKDPLILDGKRYYQLCDQAAQTTLGHELGHRQIIRQTGDLFANFFRLEPGAFRSINEALASIGPDGLIALAKRGQSSDPKVRDQALREFDVYLFSTEVSRFEFEQSFFHRSTEGGDYSLMTDLTSILLLSSMRTDGSIDWPKLEKASTAAWESGIQELTSVIPKNLLSQDGHLNSLAPTQDIRILDFLLSQDFDRLGYVDRYITRLFVLGNQYRLGLITKEVYDKTLGSEEWHHIARLAETRLLLGAFKAAGVDNPGELYYFVGPNGRFTITSARVQLNQLRNKLFP